MFRKLLNILISVLLLVSTTGFSISKHYCGDHLVSVKVFVQDEQCCSMPDCCHTESSFAQLDDDFVYSSTDINLNNDLNYDIVHYPLVLINCNYGIDGTNRIVSKFESPPPPRLQTRLIKLQTFLL